MNSKLTTSALDGIKYLTRLQSSKGFSVDFRNPGIDKVAIAAANRQWGRGIVDNILHKWHRARITQDVIFDDILGFDRTYAKSNRNAVYQAVLQSVRQDFTPDSKLIPLTLGASATHKDFPRDKSAGHPWRGMGFKNKGEVVDDPTAMEQIRRTWRMVGASRNVKLPDTLIFHRPQICTVDKNKLRAIFAYPVDVVLEEFRYLYPWMDWVHQTTRDIPIAYGIEMANGGMGYIDKMIKSAPPGSYYFLSDYKSFDKTVPPWVIKDAFEIIYEWFHDDRVRDSDGKVWEVNAKETRQRFNKMVKYFIDTPLRFHTGDRIRKQGGVPSGTGFTNLMDTLVNCIVTRYCIYQTTGALPYADMYLGDDSLIVSETPINIEAVAKCADEMFKMIINTEKSWVTTNPSCVHFLGYYNIEGVAYRPQDTILASFLYPEHITEGPQTTCARALGQLWSCLNSVDALHWLELTERLVEQYSITSEWIADYMNRYPNRFRYLRTMGIDPRKVGLPQRSILGRVLAVEPELMPKREFTSRSRNIYELHAKYIAHPIKYIPIKDLHPDPETNMS